MTQIRKAKIEDARGIGEVHVASWRTTYKGVVPEAYLKSMSVDEREKRWKQSLQPTEKKKWLFVAENNKGEIVGFAIGGENRNREQFPHYDGELYAIYLLEDYQGQGLGKELVRAVTAELKDFGLHTMLVQVLADNPAKKFYKNLGAEYVTRKALEIQDKQLQEEIYGWETIDSI